MPDKGKSKRYITGIVFALYFLVAAGVLIVGEFFMNPGDEMGFAVLDLYVILPVAGLIYAKD